MRPCVVVVLLLLLVSPPARTLADPSPSATPRNLLVNGDFAKGSVDQPDEWRTEAWINSPDAFQHHWVHRAGEPNELEVENLKANDARWEQPLSLEEGFYHASVEVRTENVGGVNDGATISIMTDGIMSPDVKATSGWRRVGFYFHVGRHGADIDIALRVGGYGSLNAGRAFFRHARLEKIATLPKDAAPMFDWDAIQKAEIPAPIGRLWTMPIVFALLVAMVIFGWWTYGSEPPPAPASPDRAPRAAGKRRSK
jgi:dolichyl-phosphate-mannose-protein mannosyltransferase